MKTGTTTPSRADGAPPSSTNRNTTPPWTTTSRAATPMSPRNHEHGPVPQALLPRQATTATTRHGIASPQHHVPDLLEPTGFPEDPDFFGYVDYAEEEEIKDYTQFVSCRLGLGVQVRA
ncbi:unnamed protein product [Urochloa humidicola]